MTRTTPDPKRPRISEGAAQRRPESNTVARPARYGMAMPISAAFRRSRRSKYGTRYFLCPRVLRT